MLQLLDRGLVVLASLEDGTRTNNANIIYSKRPIWSFFKARDFDLETREVYYTEPDGGKAIRWASTPEDFKQHMEAHGATFYDVEDESPEGYEGLWEDL